jgi:hypothetical protein
MWIWDRHDIAHGLRRCPAPWPASTLLAAMFVLAAPAAAATSGSRIEVSATVLPSCLVSTAAPANSNRDAAVSCDNFGDGSVAIERDRPESGASRGTARSDSRQDSSSSSGIIYVTVSY